MFQIVAVNVKQPEKTAQNRNVLIKARDRMADWPVSDRTRNLWSFLPNVVPADRIYMWLKRGDANLYRPVDLFLDEGGCDDQELRDYRMAWADALIRVLTPPEDIEYQDAFLRRIAPNKGDKAWRPHRTWANYRALQIVEKSIKGVRGQTRMDLIRVLEDDADTFAMRSWILQGDENITPLNVPEPEDPRKRPLNEHTGWVLALMDLVRPIYYSGKTLDDAADKATSYNAERHIYPTKGTKKP